RHQKETAPVTGRVTLDGTPLTSGVVFFVPVSGRGATGEIGADGTYRLGPYQPGDGAAVGTHQAAVFPKAPSPEFDAATSSQQVPARYQAPNTSGIEVEVVAGQTNIHDLKLTTKP